MARREREPAGQGTLFSAPLAPDVPPESVRAGTLMSVDGQGNLRPTRLVSTPLDEMDLRGIRPGEVFDPLSLNDRTDVDELAEMVRRATGCGFSVFRCAPGHQLVDQLVMISWDSLPRMKKDGAHGTGRAGWFPSERAALNHVIRYEQIHAAEGKEAAELFHTKQRCRTEVEAVARLEEQQGIKNEDPHKGGPRKARRSP